VNAIKTYLLEDFLNSPRRAGRVHSVFEHALNIAFSEDMITVHADLNAGVPDGVVLAQKDFESLRRLNAGTSAVLNLGEIHLPEHSIILRAAHNCGNAFHAVSEISSKQEIARRLDSLEFIHTLPERTESLLRELSESVAAKDSAACERLLPNVIGLGSGLTPSADDALLGIMAVMAFYAAAKIEIMPEFSEKVCRLSLNRTTDVSRKYLRCAAQGRFSTPLVCVVSSLLEAGCDFDRAAFAKLLETGHSSGRDTFRGVVIAVKNIQQW